jgi:hypothetical protein
MEGRGKYHRHKGTEEIGVGREGAMRQAKFTSMSRMDRMGKRDGELGLIRLRESSKAF